MPKIEKLPSGNYSMVVYLGTDRNGKKIRKRFTHPDKKTLRRIASEYEDDHRVHKDSVILSDALNTYLSARENELSPSTIRGYRCISNTLNREFAPFCALTLENIKPDNLQKLINNLRDLGRSPKYIRNIHGLISSVMTFYDLQIPRVRLPERKPPKVYEPSKDDIKRTIAAAAGTRLEIPILLAIHGLRRGEICALRYPDDFDENIIHVQRSRVYVGANTNIDKTPKNYTSDRFVPLDPALVDKISSQGFVTDYTPGALSEEFPDFLKRNHIRKFRFHDLRHFFASYMHDQGFTDAQIMKMGGWKTDHVMKRVYRYALQDDDFAARVTGVMQDLTS